jgi:tetratricopeptide (TPR) repeat protein
MDESALFSDEQEFFNFAGELQTEMKQDAAPDMPEVSGGDVPLEEIFREFKKGVEQQLSPEDYETHYNLGIAYKEMSLTDEAISEFQRAAKSPQYAVECCSMLGLCFLEKGLPQLAIKWYRKGLEAPNIREEDRLGLQYDLANLYASVGDRESAYRTFLEIYGSNASFRDVGERLKELAPA